MTKNVHAYIRRNRSSQKILFPFYSTLRKELTNTNSIKCDYKYTHRFNRQQILNFILYFSYIFNTDHHQGNLQRKLIRNVCGKTKTSAFQFFEPETNLIKYAEKHIDQTTLVKYALKN